MTSPQIRGREQEGVQEPRPECAGGLGASSRDYGPGRNAAQKDHLGRNRCPSLQKEEAGGLQWGVQMAQVGRQMGACGAVGRVGERCSCTPLKELGY